MQEPASEALFSARSPEDGGDMSLRNFDFQRSTCRCIPENRSLKTHCLQFCSAENHGLKEDNISSLIISVVHVIYIYDFKQWLGFIHI
jgi:hypothetical protein